MAPSTRAAQRAADAEANLAKEEAGREANNYGRAMELSISLILATGCAAMRVCPTVALTFIDCVVWAYRSQDDLLEQDQFFDPYGTFDQSMNGYKDIPPSMGIETKSSRGGVTGSGHSIHFQFVCEKHEPPFLDRALGTDLPLPPVAYILVCDIPEGWYTLHDNTPVPAQRFYLLISPGVASTVFKPRQRHKCITFRVRDDGTLFYSWEMNNRENAVDLGPYLVTEEELADKVHAAALEITATGDRRPSLREIELGATSVRHHTETLGMLRHCEAYDINLWSLMARGGDPHAPRAPMSRRQRQRDGWHFPFYSPLPDCTVDWYMLPTHPLHAALAKRLGRDRNAIIGVQGKACFMDSATTRFGTTRGYHVDDERLQVFQFQVLVPVVGGQIIPTNANLKPFSKAFSEESARRRSRAHSHAVQAVVAGRRHSAKQGQLLLEVFVTMAELEQYGLFDADGYLIQIMFAIPDGRPWRAGRGAPPEDVPELEEGEGGVFLFSDTSGYVSSPDLLGLLAPGSKMDMTSLKWCLTRIRNGTATDFTPLYRNMAVPADRARFLRGETRSLVSVMDGDGPNQAVREAWPTQGWPKRQRRR